MRQTWHDLLFMHWPIDRHELRRMIPATLNIDAYEGQTWLGIVPFRMSGIHFRGTPALPYLSAFPELNLRTYVQLDGKPGVYFFSLEVTNPIAVAVARLWFHLPYFLSQMKIQARDNVFHYSSKRLGKPSSVFEVSYQPVAPVEKARSGSLAYWFTERYCLYTTNARGRVYRGEIAHEPWPLQSATASIGKNTLANALGFSLPPVDPILHFAARQDVHIWPLQPL